MEEDTEQMMAKRQSVSRTSGLTQEDLWTAQKLHLTGAELEVGLERTYSWLLTQQKADGHWVAELEGDTILESV